MQLLRAPTRSYFAYQGSLFRLAYTWVRTSNSFLLWRSFDFPIQKSGSST